MGRPAKPLVAHRLSGTLRLDRHANRVGELSSEGLGVVGKPPAYFDAEMKKEWNALANHPVYGKVLTSLDRQAFEEYIVLCKRFRDDAKGALDSEGNRVEMRPTERQMLASLRMQLGVTPASRAKVRMPERPMVSKWEVLRNNKPQEIGGQRVPGA